MFSLLIYSGIGLCHHTIKAKENVTTNTSTYTVSIPSEIDINAEGEASSFNVTGELHKRYWMNLEIISENDFKMKNKKGNFCFL